MTAELAVKRIADWELELAAELSHGSSASDLTWVIRCFESVGSTMDEAALLCGDLGEFSPALVLTRAQTKGRGRQGRAWQESTDALYVTFGFATPAKLADLSSFPLVVGCVLRDVLQALKCKVGLKWPNDVLALDGRKLAGVLVESRPSAELNCLLVGIGLNLKAAPDRLPQSVSLVELGGPVVSPVQMAGLIAAPLLTAWEKFKQQGFKAFNRKWLDSALFIGEELVVTNSGASYQGKFVGVDEHGVLLLKGEDGEKKIIAGHVELKR